ncbi:MAG: coiled coil domain-containing protein [Cyanobacteria bacterium P01_A01_bin.84]
MEDKQDYQQKMQGQLENIQTKIDELKVKASLAKADAKDAYEEQINILGIKQQEAQMKLQELTSSSESAWQDIKDGMESAWNDLQGAFNKAASNFN